MEAENKKIKVVCLGGGNAMPKAILSDLKHHPVKISVICAMLDSGGSAGRLRKDYKIVSPGDIRRAFVALANTSPVFNELFDYRFEAGELKGHNFANLFITALELSSKNYKKTLGELNRVLNINPDHKVLPATLDKATLCAKLENGKVICGETNIDIPKHNGNLKIEKVFLKPRAKAYKEALTEIKTADIITIGPGDLYSSLAQILLVDGIAPAIRKSRAKKVYICNLMTKFGETNTYGVSDFSKQIEDLLGGDVDYVIYNKEKISPARIKKAKKDGELAPADYWDKNGKELNGDKFIGVDIVSDKGEIVHDAKKLVNIILSLSK